MNLKEKIISLIDKSNETTSKGDPDLTESVKTLCEGYGIGLNNNNIKFGSFDLPNNVFQSKFIETGFEPVNVIAYVFDTTNQLHTYTVCYGYDKSHQKGEYYQTDGFSRSFTADNTTGSNKGHVIGVTENGFNVQTCESYFANTMCQYVAVGRPIIKDLANIMGVTPLTLSNSLGKILVSWNMTGDIKQDVGTYTAAAMEVTADGIEDETDYPYFNTSNFENVVVGDEVNFSGDGLSYPMTAKKIEDGNVYFENTGIDDTVTGTVPLTLEKANGKELKSWSITGNTEQNVTPTPAESSEVKGVGNKTDQLIPFPFLSDISSKPTFEPKIIKGLTVYVDEHGVIHIDGTSNANNVDIYIFGGWNSTAYNLGVKNLYITCSSNKVDGYVGIYEKSQNAYRFISSYSKTNISDSDFINFIFLRVSNSGTTFDNEEIRVMASETGFTEFKPYGYGMPIESGGLSTTIYLNTPLMTDEILKSDGTRDVKWGKYAFTGNEMLFKNDTQPNNYLFYTYISQISSNIKKDTGFCTHLKIIDEPPVDSIGMNIKNRFDAVYLNFGIDIMTSQPSGNTVEGLMEYLKSEYNKGTPVTVWYQLATPTTKIIDIPTIPTIKGVTVLDIDSEVKPTYLSAEYTKSIDFSKPVTRDYSFNYPSPKHTSEVKGVGERTGNLFDINTWDNVMATRGTIEKVANGFKITATSEDAYSRTYNSLSYSYKGESGKEYTLSWDVDKTNISGVVYVFSGVDKGNEMITHIPAGSKKISFTIPTGHTYFSFRIGVTRIGNSLTYTNIMLNEGSTALPYEPYGYKITEVTRGKNLVNQSEFENLSNWTEVQQGTNRYILDIRGLSIGEQYIVSSDENQGNKGYFIYINRYDENGVSSNVAKLYQETYLNAKSRTFTVEKGYKYRFWIWSINPTNMLRDVKNIQLELGSTSTEYEPYIEPKTSTIYLNSPLMADEVLRSDGSREVEWGVKVFDGSENVDYDKPNKRFYFPQIIPLYSDTKRHMIYCSHYDGSKYDKSINGIAFAYANQIFMYDDRFDTSDDPVASFKSFLKSEYDVGHPVTVWYPLAEPSTVSVDVPQIPTLTGNSIIDVDTEVKPTNMSITYKKTL